jgi:kynurenine formamidase
MPRRYVDLSIAIENDVPSDPPGMEVNIRYSNHAQTVRGMAGFFDGLRPEDLPDGEGWAVETITLSTHNGTHMDAPWHFHSTTDHGARRAPTIDETPLEYCYRPGVKLDFRHFPDGYVATLYLTERGVRVVGTDAWSWDAPFSHTARKWAETRDPAIIWEGHKAGREIPYWQMEKLHGLAALPAHGFEVSCFPVKIRGASAGWTRAVAIFDE